MTKTTNATKALAAAKSKRAKLDDAAREPVTNRSAGYSAGELDAKPAKGKPAPKAPTKLDDDKIVNIANAKGAQGAKVAETEASKATGKGALALPLAITADLRKLAIVGGSLKAVRSYIATHKPDAKLAHGVTARTSPNAAKAASDQRTPTSRAPATNNAGPQPKAKLAGKPATSAPKAERKPNVTPEAGKRLSGQAYGGKVTDDMRITVVAGSSPYKSGTKADATFALFGKAATVAEFRKLVAKSPDKYDAGYIRYAARDGFIVLK